MGEKKGDISYYFLRILAAAPGTPKLQPRVLVQNQHGGQAGNFGNAVFSFCTYFPRVPQSWLTMMKFGSGPIPGHYLRECQVIASLITLEGKQRIFFVEVFTEPSAPVNVLLLR